MNFEHVKKGDTVLYRWHSLDGVCVRARVVERVTKTQIVCGYERFSRKTGYRLPAKSSFRSPGLVENTPENAAKAKVYELAQQSSRLLQQLRMRDLEKLPAERAEKLESLLREAVNLTSGY